MHTLFVIKKYVLLKQVYVQIKCILSSYPIYILNSIAHTKIKWNSHAFDIVLPTTVCKLINVNNMIRVIHDCAYVC